MNTKLLKSIFNGHEVDVYYTNGKQLRVFYGKYDYISIPIDRCPSDESIRNEASKYKRVVIDLINLINWVKPNKKAAIGINKILKEYFMMDVGFNICYKENIIISCMGEDIVIDCHNINDSIKTDLISDVLLRAASMSGQKRIKHIKDNLPNAIIKTYSSRLNDFYKNELMNSFAWIKFEGCIKDLYVSHEEFMESIRKNGFVFINNCKEFSLLENIESILDLKNYQITHSEEGIKFYNKGSAFLIEDGKYKCLCDMQHFENIKKSILFYQKMQYDIYSLFKKVSQKNVCFRITEDGHMHCHIYSGCICCINANEVYSFLQNAIKNINSVVEATVNDEKLLAYIYANNVNCMKQCMDMYEKIDFSSFCLMCSCRRVTANEATAVFFNIPDILAYLKRTGIIKEWHINGDGSYFAEFEEDSILKYDCVEAGTIISTEKINYSFNEAELFPEKYMEALLKDKDSVYKNTKQILESMDRPKFCEVYKNFLIDFMQYMDKKYLPVLKVKTLKINADKIYGEELLLKMKQFAN